MERQIRYVRSRANALWRIAKLRTLQAPRVIVKREQLLLVKLRRSYYRDEIFICEDHPAWRTEISS